jgi:hypothetical protein
MSVEQEQQQPQEQSPDTQSESQQLDLLQPEGEQTNEQPPEAQEETDEQKAARLVKEGQIRQKRETNRREAERRLIEKERDTYRQLVEKVLAREERQQQPQQPQKSTEPTRDYNPETGKPYVTYDEFIEERAAWRAEQRAIKAIEAKLNESFKQVAEHQQRQVVDRQEQAHTRRMIEFAQQVPDFEEIAARDDVEIPKQAGKIIKQMANGPALILALAQRPELAENLKGMETDVEMASYLGQLSQWINSHRASQISNAAPSGKTVGAKPASSSTPPDDPDDYERWANKRFGRR